MEKRVEKQPIRGMTQPPSPFFSLRHWRHSNHLFGKQNMECDETLSNEFCLFFVQTNPTVFVSLLRGLKKKKKKKSKGCGVEEGGGGGGVRTLYFYFYLYLTYGRWASTCLFAHLLQRCHPCLWSLRIFPSLLGSCLRTLIAMLVLHSYASSTDCRTLLTPHVRALSFPLRKTQ